MPGVQHGRGAGGGFRSASQAFRASTAAGSARSLTTSGRASIASTAATIAAACTSRPTQSIPTAVEGGNKRRKGGERERGRARVGRHGMRLRGQGRGEAGARVYGRWGHEGESSRGGQNERVGLSLAPAARYLR